MKEKHAERERERERIKKRDLELGTMATCFFGGHCRMLRVAAGKDMERGIKKEGLSSHNEVTQNANLPLV